MKKAAASLILAVLCLTGCGKENPELERGLALRARAQQAQGCSFSAKMEADFGDQLYEFSLDCQGSSGGEMAFQVTGPETISGITGTLSQEGGALTFEETALAFPMLSQGLVSPVSGPWLFWKALTAGCVTSACMEEGQLRLSLDDSYEENALQLDIWCDGEDLPARVEICQEGRRILTISLSNFTIL